MQWLKVFEFNSKGQVLTSCLYLNLSDTQTHILIKHSEDPLVKGSSNIYPLKDVLYAPLLYIIYRILYYYFKHE